MFDISKTTKSHILIVDDSPDNLRLLSKIVESQGYVVRKSLSGKLAIQSARRNPPDLILLDINMPEMDGYAVCQALQSSKLTDQVPIIFISALDQVSDKLQAFAAGGKDYITKPFQELEVLARIRNQLLIQQQRRQLETEVRERQIAEAEIRRLNITLERQVQSRTLELQQALKFEITLKRITDKVRDSLDPNHILQTAVAELAIALEADYCHAILSPSEQPTPSEQLTHSGQPTPSGQPDSHYQYHSPASNIAATDLERLLNGIEMDRSLKEPYTWYSFCPWHPQPGQESFAVLTCPIFDHQVEQFGILGNLGLFKAAPTSFSSMETHLVQQVANQCAIALRQATLYAAAQAQVQELERLSQLKDDFLSTISHELRTPIASMKMVIKLLTTITNEGQSLMFEIAQAPNQQSKIVEYFRVLQEECDRELKLVEDLLSLQHIEAGNYLSNPIPINLHDLIPHLAEPFELRAQHQQQTLQVCVPDHLPTVSLDLRSMNRIITELLSNACKYTPAGEQIVISANLLPQSASIHPQNLLQLSVSNSGVEIAPAEQRHVFDKFYRIPNHDPWKYGGTGLGLALVKKLVEQMGGEIAVQSANNQTCFKVQLAIATLATRPLLDL